MAKPSNHRGVQIWRQPQLRILVFNPPIEKVVLIEEDQLGKLANKSPRPGYLAPSPLNLMVFTTLKIAMYSNVLSFSHTNLPSPKALPGSMLPGFFVSPPGDAASILYTELVQANSRSKPGRVPGYRGTVTGHGGRVLVVFTLRTREWNQHESTILLALCGYNGIA